MNKWSQDDRQHVKIPGSWERVCFNEVMSFMQNECVRRKLPAPVQMLPPNGEPRWATRNTARCG